MDTLKSVLVERETISPSVTEPAAAGINLIGQHPDELGKAITASALVETYAIFALLISLLPVLFFTPGA